MVLSGCCQWGGIMSRRPDGTLRIDIVGSGGVGGIGIDTLAVSGDAVLAGGLEVDLLGGLLIPGLSLEFLDVEGTTSGGLR